MNVVGHSPPPFFKRGPAPLARLTFYLALAVMLMVADLRFHTLEWLRIGLNTVAWPLQRLAQLPLEAGGDLGQYLTRVSTLQTENQELHTRQLSTANMLLRQRHLEDENRQLRALLDMRSRQPVGGQVADILYAARDPFARRIIINKGLQANISGGEAVIDDLGVIGQVTRVFPLTAEVTLLTDKEQAIPIQVERNGLRAVLAGAGAGSMELRFLAANADVQVGDTLVTSGLDGIYLPGLPVARVIKIDRDQAFSFARIFCEPLAGVERHGLVLVLDHRETLPPRPDELEPVKESGIKGRGRKP
ncbi:rod shape-determining protein MreC [Denitratisoma oestradiolicum]|uniref:Cell shape-determining protein MreC n=1 Tax=Denitratisoma oestradiolicum TaxID=311182 RepID=A0A6S6XUP7_9PROT|nr:rod shape-determining protein MreC [Denitratisoma oestradiolicum]TWO81064.1 rod shape-determining protein MreC [Denitratisoma oestradiolicum]CAB1367737.1 Cell shape-determining protein MreC [Denitratisoma oestradiolicum]